MIGIDIEEIARFERMYARKPRLVKRLFSLYEWQYANAKSKPPQTLAGFWCAKEAVVKAVSAIQVLSIHDVHITHASNGAPLVTIVNPQFTDSFKVQVSIAHSKHQATAIAMIV
ncbi:holo-ACP synthase [Polaribacter litorisediminis]|uniref:holo-ACP synthase n=1 Tax=Polaribacter litorisediminis TaxID=1908341 RepID=UPI001CC0DA26|nr:holo-ACP synthase [Polaribacter litorisediminis]UAM96586.1 holo-ACP synthase [Polaribacter litorisediminis]